MFVPPNSLNLDKIAVMIVDPSNYIPVLTVLSVTSGLYLLVLVWARREDRKDIQKVIVDSHSYSRDEKGKYNWNFVKHDHSLDTVGTSTKFHGPSPKTFP